MVLQADLQFAADAVHCAGGARNLPPVCFTPPTPDRCAHTCQVPTETETEFALVEPVSEFKE